jgi:Mn-dependent DtxR family transcriptional regulator
MTREEIKITILRRAYEGAFMEGIEYTFNLHAYAKDNGIDNDEIGRAFEELRGEGFIGYNALGGIVVSTSAGILYCEKQKIVDEAVIAYQNKIRTKLLVTLADIQDKSAHGDMVDREEWIREAGVNIQDFTNNDRILRDSGLVRRETLRHYIITPHGREMVRDYKKRVKRLEDFEKLEKLEGVNEQQRGHLLEDLLAETAEYENWDVKRRMRAQGQENDIIMHVGLQYFLSSCKWEKDPVQSKEVELLESRVRSRAITNGGILFSMSGFTVNCIEEVRLKMASALLILFGPADISCIMHNEISLTDLLDEKVDQVMNHRKILVDGELR